ncbi:MAG: hypothetical protein Q8S73_43250 [Deltaproteobacteria bacterium]|nr:hypothetical protein [Deltaproteobacteria bacterium]
MLRWTHSFGSAKDVATDGVGNIFAVGQFSGLISSFPASATLESAGGTDGFVESLTSTGAYRWALRVGGSGNDRVLGVSADASGNVYVIGEFSGTVDLGGGLVTSVGMEDTFISCYSGSGLFRWTRHFGSMLGDRPTKITNDPSGNVYVTGQTPLTVDFGGVTIRPGGYIVSLSSTGIFRWSRSLGGSSGGFFLDGIRSDASGNVYIAGGFSGTNPVDLGAGRVMGGGDFYTIVLASYTPLGSYRWGQAFGGSRSIDVAEALVLMAA